MHRGHRNPNRGWQRSPVASVIFRAIKIEGDDLTIPGHQNKQGHDPASSRFRHQLADAHHLAGGLCRKSVIGQDETGLQVTNRGVDKRIRVEEMLDQPTPRILTDDGLVAVVFDRR